jgi:hypothetical protein
MLSSKGVSFASSAPDSTLGTASSAGKELTMPQSRSNIDIAYLVLENGRPYGHTISKEGSVESGPYVLTFRGIRWGKLHLESGPGYSHHLSIRDDREPYAMKPLELPPYIPDLHEGIWNRCESRFS